MSPTAKPLWQQVTALVSLSTGGAITGFSFVPGAVADLTTPTSMPIRLMALEKSVQPAAPDEATLRSAIVNVASYYLRMAQGKTPAEMEQIIWQRDSLDGVDHGASCAAFASLTLELGAQVVGQQSWVTGGTSYPWPLHTWADVRVDPNPSSPGITSILQDAQANHRWHPLDDGYQPMPGDWVLFDGHVEVVTNYAGGTLHTIGGDSGPDLSVNAHQYPGPLGAQGVAGFVNNGGLTVTASRTPPAPGQVNAGDHQPDQAPLASPSRLTAADPGLAAIPGASQARAPQPATAQSVGGAAIPATPMTGAATPAPSHTRPATPAPPQARPATGPGPDSDTTQPPRQPRPGRTHVAGDGLSPAQARPDTDAEIDVPGTGPLWPPASPRPVTPGSAAIPGLPAAGHGRSGRLGWARATPHRRPHSSRAAPARPPASPASPETAQPPAPAQRPASASPAATSSQQQFIDMLVPGAIAAQRKYGVPAAVTIAQAIEESGWGQSDLAARDHNLFGIKGTGPAGSDMLPTQEFENGQMVNRTAIFRVYHDFAESIDDHGRLLATSGYYRQAMADRQDPDKFAASLTGIYATDPAYGAKLIGIMQQYGLYRYDAARPPAPTGGPGTGGASIPGLLAPTTPAPSSRPSHPGHPARQHVRPAGTPRPSGPAPGPQPSRPAPTPRPSAPSSRPRPSGPPPAARPSGSTATPRPSGTAPSPLPSRPAPAPPPPAPAPTPTPETIQPAPTSAPAPTRSTAPAPRPGPPGSVPSAPGTPPALARRSPKPIQAQLVSDIRVPWTSSRPARTAATRVRPPVSGHYHHHLPLPVRNAFLATARGPILAAKPLYRDVASHSGLRWELLATCDWMQCKARPRYSPVHGEKLGTLNPDGTIYHTKSEALEQVAEDLIDLAGAVYQIDLTAGEILSLHDLANVFAAFRWGGLLKLHRTSAMEFPYSVAGLTDQHINMRWPNIDDPNTPDKPGGRFHQPFGAVAVMLSLNYPAIA
jgi:flagellum-specific peptidoglycan hydrolase FlgJ